MPLPLPLLLASKELAAHKLRTAFSVISVALGTAVILAADYTSQAIRNAGSELGQASGTLPFASEFLGLALTGMGFLILLVAGFLIYNAFAMSITQRQQLVGALRALGTTRPQIMRIVLAILERRQEFGLLRAVGCTRPQIIALVVGEAGLLGLAGGVMGLGAGLGLVAIFIGVNGGSMWGLNDINLGAAVGESLTKALGTGGVGLLAAPLLTAVAAYFPARHLVRGSAISTLNPAYEETSGYRPQASGA